MKKLIIVFALILSMTMSLASLAAPAMAAEAEIQVYVEGARLVLDVPPIIIDGRTLVPMRAIFETLGYKVDWNENIKQVTATRPDSSIILQIGNKQATLNGKTIELDVAALIQNGRTLVPLRFVGESSGKVVEWDAARRCVYVGTPPSPLPPIPAPTYKYPTFPKAWWDNSIYQEILDYAATKDGLVTHIEVTSSSVKIYVAEKWPRMNYEVFTFTNSGASSTLYRWDWVNDIFFVLWGTEPFYRDDYRDTIESSINARQFAYDYYHDKEPWASAPPGAYPWQ